MYQEIIKNIKPELDKTISFMESELTKLRTGRATPAMVENAMCDCFGERFPLKQLAAITCPDAKTIMIQPWDKSYTEGITSALSKSTLGALPIVDRDIIRITLPPLSEEFRKEMQRMLSQKLEQAKVTIRHWREKAWEEIQEKFKEGLIREDDKFRGKDELQKLIDEYNEKIDQIGEKKDKEIFE